MGIQERELFELLEPVIAAQGADLVEVSLGSSGRRALVRIVIHSASGISHGDCARVTRAASGILDERGAIVGGYVLEVSSPGTDRVLRDAREFELFRGKPVRMWLQGEENERRELSGVCRGTREGEGVVLETEGGELTVIPWPSVSKARLVPEAPGARRFGGKRR